MLAHRIATALVLLVVLVATLSTRNMLPFAALMFIAVVACAWEWGRLSGLAGGGALALAGLTAALIAATVLWVDSPATVLSQSSADASRVAWWVPAITWLVGLVIVLRIGVDGWRGTARGVRIVIGVVILVLTWWALVQARALGVNFLLSTLALIWASDIAAYFGGKAWGGRVFGARKLALSISPGKTWEGAFSGMAGALLLAVFWVLVVDVHVPVDGPSLPTRLVTLQSWTFMLAAVAILTVAGILGDLFESLVKRAAGAKDSSRLLPGHGGVLDRVDALLPVLPIALALVQLGR